MISNAIVEWVKWEEKLLLSGEAEARSSQALQKKLSSGYWLYFFYADQDECSTAEALVILEYAVDARATKNKKTMMRYYI